jgi:hypothetical protein
MMAMLILQIHYIEATRVHNSHVSVAFLLARYENTKEDVCLENLKRQQTIIVFWRRPAAFKVEPVLEYQ